MLGGLLLVIRVSEPLRDAAEADPLIDVGKASSVDLRRPTGLSGSDAMRGSEEGGSQFDIVTVPELMEHPDVGGFADPPSTSQLMQNTGVPRNLENDRLGRRDGMDIPPTFVPRDMSHCRIVERRLWSGPLARRLRGY